MNADDRTNNPTTASASRLAAWDEERERLRSKLVTSNTQQWQDDISKGSNDLTLVGGVDLSFIKGNDSAACAAFVVCSFPSMEVVHEDLRMIELTAPYVPGYLAFREAGPLVGMIREQRESKPELTPQVIILDGNGVLHPHHFGLACHVGVELDLPTVGVAKNLFQMNDEGLLRDDDHKRSIDGLKDAGDTFELKDGSGRVLGLALKSCDAASKPVFVSVGHGIGLGAAAKLVAACSKFRVPEPTRQADMKSREFLRKRQS